MIVRIPGLLHSYTAGARTVELALDDDASLDQVLRALDRRYPGLRFRLVDEQDRVRPHIRLFVDGAPAPTLSAAVGRNSELVIVGALSGG